MCFGAEDTAHIMLMAGEESMLGPDYAYLWFAHQPSKNMDTPWVELDDTHVSRHVFDSLKMVIILYLLSLKRSIV